MLATNAKLKRWGKRSNSKCSLCKIHETLHHILNNCNIMLDRYTWRHNSVLNNIFQTLTSLQCTLELRVDIGDKLKGISTIPSDILVTAQRPVLVCIDRPNSSIYILELTICFETNFDAAHKRKLNRYASLTTDLEIKGYKVNYSAVEIGSRGFVNKDNQSRLKSFFRTTSKEVKWSETKTKLSTTSLLGLYVIYSCKGDVIWNDPPLIVQ